LLGGKTSPLQARIWGETSPYKTWKGAKRHLILMGVDIFEALTRAQLEANRKPRRFLESGAEVDVAAREGASLRNAYYKDALALPHGTSVGIGPGDPAYLDMSKTNQHNIAVFY
jgi:hypothetical protein